jgi:hypothetical protein
MATWPEGLASSVLAAVIRMAASSATTRRSSASLASLALELNPAATLVPAGTTDAGQERAGADCRDHEIMTKTLRDKAMTKRQRSDKKLHAEELLSLNEAN